MASTSISYINDGIVGSAESTETDKSNLFKIKSNNGWTSPSQQQTKPFTPSEITENKYYFGSAGLKRDLSINIGGGSNNPFKDTTISECVDKINSQLYIPNSNETPLSLFNTATSMYNRFKVPNLNSLLTKGFAHVFFVRPSCNIITSGSTNNLIPEIKSHELFAYASVFHPEILGELSNLSTYQGKNDDFMLSLSNAAQGFSSNDEQIATEAYGRTYTGYKIAYGKHSTESKTAGTFSVDFMDDRDSRIYQIIRLWVEYISGVYRGTLSPLNTYIQNKILDYVSAAYYIVTAEDGETIIFWSKYYGVFPINVPATQYSWGAGSTIGNPKHTIEFQYSFKKDYSPYTILEFNKNARLNGDVQSEPIYDKSLMHAGKTWVGTPYIVTEKNDIGQCLKLKFKKV